MLDGNRCVPRVGHMGPVKNISKCWSGQGDVGLFMASDNGPSIKQTLA